MIKTVIENKQKALLFKDVIFLLTGRKIHKKYLDNTRYYCLIMSENYIRNHFDDIKNMVMSLKII